MLKKIASYILAFSLVAALFSGNPVGAEEIIEISNADQLFAISQNMKGSYRLTDNIVLPDEEYSPIGSSSTPFSGILDGNGYTIKNLTITAGGTISVYAGLFAASSGTIKNLRLENVAFNIPSGSNYVYIGAFAGNVHSGGSVINCYSQGEISLNLTEGIFSRVGGIAGRLQQGSIESCVSNIEINYTSACNAYIGGIAGEISGNVINSENRAALNISTTPSIEGEMSSTVENNMKSSSICVGGIGGVFSGENASIEGCLNNGDVYAESYSSLCVGGGLGYYINNATGSIKDFINYGAVETKVQGGGGFYTSQETYVFGAIVGAFLGTTSGNYYLSSSASAASDSSINASALSLEELRTAASGYSRFYLPTDASLPPYLAAYKVVDRIEVSEVTSCPCNASPDAAPRVIFNDGSDAAPLGLIIEEQADENKIIASYDGAAAIYQYTVNHIDVRSDETGYAATCKTEGLTSGTKCYSCYLQITSGGDPIPLDPDNHEGTVISSPDNKAATDSTAGLIEKTEYSCCSKVVNEGRATYIVKFLDYYDEVVYSIELPEGETPEAAAETAEGYILMPYGYSFKGWDASVQEPVDSFLTFSSVYERNPEDDLSLTVGGEDKGYISFDTKISLSASQKALWMVNSQKYDIGEQAIVYAFGDMDIQAQELGDIDEAEPFVSLLGTIAKEDKYIAFVHIYSAGLSVDQLGAQYYDAAELEPSKFKKLALSQPQSRDAMVTLYGIAEGKKRGVRAYAKVGGNEIYSEAASHQF